MSTLRNADEQRSTVVAVEARMKAERERVQVWQDFGTVM